MEWYQLYVTGKNGPITPQQAGRIDDGIQRFGALFCRPDHNPIQEADGTYEVRVYEQAVLSMVKRYLDSQGMVVVREVKNDDNQDDEN